MRTILAPLLFVFAACGAAPQTPAVVEAAPSADAPAAPKGDAPAAAASAAPEAPATHDAPAAPQESDAQALARDLLRSGGRRIGWSAAKKGFVLPVRHRTGASLSLDLAFVDDAGHPRETMKVCGAPECDEHMSELADALMPKLAARLDADKYVAVRAIGWPTGRDELDVSSLNMTLRVKGGAIEGVHEGKPTVRIGSVRPTVLIALFVVPESKRLGVLSAPSADAQEPDQVFSVLPLP